MEKEKIILTYQDEEEYRTESIWAERIGKYYKVKNIPFFATSIALDDIIQAEKDDDGLLYFEDLITPSGNSEVQIIFNEIRHFSEVTSNLEKLNCGWEGSHLPTLISVNIPKEVNYSIVKEYLEKLRKENLITYKEACLAF